MEEAKKKHTHPGAHSVWNYTFTNNIVLNRKKTSFISLSCLHYVSLWLHIRKLYYLVSRLHTQCAGIAFQAAPILCNGYLSLTLNSIVSFKFTENIEIIRSVFFFIFAFAHQTTTREKKPRQAKSHSIFIKIKPMRCKYSSHIKSNASKLHVNFYVCDYVFFITSIAVELWSSAFIVTLFTFLIWLPANAWMFSSQCWLVRLNASHHCECMKSTFARHKSSITTFKIWILVHISSVQELLDI